MRLCTKCKVNEKYVAPGGTIDSYCYTCLLAENRRRYDPRKAKDRDLKKKYGITLLQYEAMLEAQDGKCAICKAVCTRQLAVDHCHASNQVRGLLCMNCNNGLGRFKDNPEALREAATYIENARIE